jgi:polyisoprenoid-binding protein YceI
MASVARLQPAVEDRGLMARNMGLWLGVALAAAGPARATPVPYVLDQRYATIGFTTSGLFGTQGYFHKFTGRLELDFTMPENSTVDVTLDDSAITLSWPPGVQMLTSPAYFDSRDFPEIRFHSLSIRQSTVPGQYIMLGALTIRGVTRPQMMTAILLTGTKHEDTADFYVTGTMRRSDFGMVADQAAVDDKVTLQIHARVMVAK